MQKLLIPLFFLANSLLLSGCTNWEFPWVYRIDVDQGNIITQEKVNQLKPGMSREQVRFVMGSPLLADTFNENRWDYIYTLRDGEGKNTEQRLTVIFVDDQLARLSGTLMPQASAPSTTTPATEAPAVIPAEENTDNNTL